MWLNECKKQGIRYGLYATVSLYNEIIVGDIHVYLC